MKLAFKDFFLKADQIKTPVYFFTGPNDFLKLRAKERLLSRPDFAGFSKIRMEGAGFDVQSLWEGLNTSDLFSNGEIYIVEKTDRLNAASKRSLLEVLDDFEEKEGISKIIVFISESDRQDITDPLEGHLLANQNACHIFFPALTEAEALSWAKSHLRRNNIKAPETALEKAAQVCANDLYAWANLIKNLIFYLGGRPQSNLEDFEKILADSSPKEDRLIEAMNETAIGFLCSKQPDEQSLGASLQCLESLWISSPEPPQAVALRVIRVFADAVYELAAAKARVYSSRRKKDLRLASDLNRACYFWDWDGIEALYGVLIEAEFNVKKGLLPPEMAAHKFLRSFVATASVSDRPQGSAFSLGAGRISAP